MSELHSTSLKARVYCRAPPALLGELEPLARPRTFPEPSGSRLGPFLLGQIAAYPICTLMTLGFLSLLPRRRVAGLSLAGRLSMYAYLLHPLVIFNPVVWLGQASNRDLVILGITITELDTVQLLRNCSYSAAPLHHCTRSPPLAPRQA